LRYFLALLLLYINAYTSTIDDEILKQQIGRMIVIGFEDEFIEKNSTIVKQINNYNLGGVILFDKFYKNRSVTKNISSPEQLQELTSKLQSYSNKPIFISVDQEGGKVARLKPKYGFSKIPSAKTVSTLSQDKAKEIYKTQSLMLHQNGINTNFAPVVDLSVNPQNKVIVELERSYGASSEQVITYAKTLIEEQREHNIISVLKHFPGHGSSLADSHKGFVDITKTWDKKELEPYKELINSNDVDMIMTAHVFNAHLDSKYPATLSYNVNTKLLREQLNYNGVIISDDLQMKAISKHYNLKESVTLAINSGVDILLFGNQLGEQNLDELVETIATQVKNGAIKYERISESNQRIENLLTKNSIIQKPIIFNEARKEMSKEYIKSHYNLDVDNITIKPKTIVLHWTAVMDFDKCFKRLEGEKLFTDRKDIANASLLNVSAHFLVKRDGTIYQLMPDNWMARHVIGLNYSSIGIENIGGEGNTQEDLTQAQVNANISLVKYLKSKYPDIEYLLGHHEYRKMESNPLWLEKDKGYRTEKADPGKKFMSSVREKITHLGLKKP